MNKHANSFRTWDSRATYLQTLRAVRVANFGNHFEKQLRVFKFLYRILEYSKENLLHVDRKH